MAFSRGMAKAELPALVERACRAAGEGACQPRLAHENGGTERRGRRGGPEDEDSGVVQQVGEAGVATIMGRVWGRTRNGGGSRRLGWDSRVDRAA